MTQGRLAVLTAYGEPFEVREYPVPDPGPGAMVVKVMQSAICGSDLHMWRRDSEGIPVPPGGRAMGHEGTGTVFRLGEGVTTDFLGTPLAEGDRVIHSVIVGCHRCHLCLRGEENLCLAGGLGLNALLVSALENRSGFRNVFVQPVAGNAGTAIGAVLEVWQRHVPLQSLSLGPEYAAGEIK